VVHAAVGAVVVVLEVAAVVALIGVVVVVRVALGVAVAVVVAVVIPVVVLAAGTSDLLPRDNYSSVQELRWNNSARVRTPRQE